MKDEGKWGKELQLRWWNRGEEEMLKTQRELGDKRTESENEKIESEMCVGALQENQQILTGKSRR